MCDILSQRIWPFWQPHRGVPIKRLPYSDVVVENKFCETRIRSLADTNGIKAAADPSVQEETSKHLTTKMHLFEMHNIFCHYSK